MNWWKYSKKSTKQEGENMKATPLLMKKGKAFPLKKPKT